MDEIEIKAKISKKRLINKINIKYAIYQLIFLFLPNLIFSYDNFIRLTLNNIGMQQIISDKFNIMNYYPIKVRVDDEVQILRNKKVYVYNINNIIQINWDRINDNLTYMFADLSNIVSIQVNKMFSKNCNLSYFAYNCINLKTFEYSNYPFNFSISDMRYMFYNCISLLTFSFNSSEFESNYNINIGHMFYNCQSMTYLTYGPQAIKISDMSFTFYNCLKLSSIDLSQFKSETNINISYAFYNCKQLASFIRGDNIRINDMRYLFYNNIKLSTINIYFNNDGSVFYNMSYSFCNCVKLQHFIYSNFGWNMRPNDMRSMFHNCTTIGSVQISIDTTLYNVSMSKMFYNCKNLISVTFQNYYYNNYYYPSDMNEMFYNCFKLSTLSFDEFKTDYVLNMSYLFYNCKELQNFPSNMYFSNKLTTDMRGAFQNCIKLSSFTLTSFKTPNVEIMWDMFKGCIELTYVDLSGFDTSKVTDMESMFEGCSKLRSLTLYLNTPKVQYMNKMFKDCINLETLIFKNINCNSMGTMHQMFYNCKHLKYINLFSLTDRGQSIIQMFEEAADNFTFCVDNHESIPNIFNLFLSLPETRRDCSSNCYGYGNGRIDISQKKLCCPLYEYNGNCYDVCPGKTRYSGGRNCIFFDCSYLYDYPQTGCLNDLSGLPYYINDTEGKTVDKCHEDCLTCKGKGIINNTNCTSCAAGRHIYLGNCYQECKYGHYTENGGLKCECFDEKCYKCSEESLEYGLCETCNEHKGYFPKNDFISPNNTNFIDCYNTPEKYYLNGNQFEPCFNSCRYCTSDGDYSLQFCTECDVNYTFGVLMNEIDTKSVTNRYDPDLRNCYENCTYYFYFDENNNYHCTEEPKCPYNYQRRIENETRCVKNCTDLLRQNKTFEYRRVCYQECPVSPDLLILSGHICRASCPEFEEPFEMVDLQICVSNCTIMERKDRWCITNYVGNRTNVEVQDKVWSNLLKDIVDNFNFSYVNENQSIILEEVKHVYEISTTNTTVQSPKTTILKLNKCEQKLKLYYGIDEEEDLYVLKLDAYREGQTGPKVEYQVYYSFNGATLEELDLTICENDVITILVSANLTGNIDMYNQKSGFYSDICYTYTSGNGTDLTLTERQQMFYENNMSICEEGCDFGGYIADIGRVICNCEAKISEPIISEIKVDKSKLYNFIDIKKIANFDVLKCFNLVFSKAVVDGNIGFYAFLPTFVMYFICLIYFYARGFKLLRYQINEIVFAKKNYKHIFDKPEKPKPKYEPILMSIFRKKKFEIPSRFGTKKSVSNSLTTTIQNNFQINININTKGPGKSNKKDVVNQEPQYVNRINKKKISIKNNEMKMNKNIYNIDTEDDKAYDKETKNSPPIKSKIGNKSNKDITNMLSRNRADTNGSLGIKNDSFDVDYEEKPPEKRFTPQQKQRIRDIIKHTDDELNDLSYKEALKYDKRTFFQFYFALLRNKHMILSLLEKRDFNARCIKTFLCFFSFEFGYVTNALFFNDDTMHKINEDGGDFNFWYQLPQIVYSSLISYFLENFLNYLALSEEDILSVKQEKVKAVGKRGKEVLRTLRIKFIFFFIVSFIALLVFWYYICCFCAVYRNTQYHLIKDTLIGFGTGLATPLGMEILPTIFRIPALRGHSKTRELMYKLSQLLQIF